jgi:DeoR family transcriptional regulator, suf operon transcriptional repressor
MADTFVTSDAAILDLLRKQPSMTVTELSAAMQVTATAVRQRLTRLMAQGYIGRASSGSGRGRPSHAYRLTSKGERKTGTNFSDLAVALWQELRSIKEPEVRRGLLSRLSQRLSAQYKVEGDTIRERMDSLAQLFTQREIPFEVSEQNGLPVLSALACPYPELAEQDRSVCAMERMMFSELLGENVRLDQCRLDGANCCTFHASAESATALASNA